MLAITTPFPQFFDLNGAPLNAGAIYIGSAGQDPIAHPVAVAWDVAGTLPAAQPIRTMNGLPSRAGSASLLYVPDGPYSMLVKNKSGRQVFFAADASVYSSSVYLSGKIAAAAADLASTEAGLGDARVGVMYPNGGVPRTQHEKNAEFVALSDFGAVADGSTLNDGAVTTAEAASGASDIYLPPGQYKVSNGKSFTRRYWGPGSIAMVAGASVNFTGSGPNDLTTSGSFVGSRDMTIMVEISGSDLPNTWRYSSDGGVSWVTQDVVVGSNDVETVTALMCSATPYPLGHTGIYVAWGASTGHTTGARWTLLMRANPHKVNANKAFTIGGELFAWTDGDRSVAVGQNVFGNRMLGFENVGVGVDVLNGLTSGYGCVGVGVRALQGNKSGFLNNAFGVWALRDNVSGQQNCALGAYSQVACTSGSNNTSFGTDSLSWNTTGSENTAVGVQALHGNDETKVGTMMRNVAVGVQSMRDAESAAYNVSVGPFTLVACKAGSGSTAIGYQALSNAPGNGNTAIGVNAGLGLFAGDLNVYLGSGAGNDVAQKNDAQNSVAIGTNAYTTANNQIVIGATAHVETVLFGHTRPGVDNARTLGTAVARWSGVYAATGSINTSDEREKECIGAIPDEWLDAWAEVKWQCFKFKDASAAKGDGSRWHIGVIAQRVQAAFESRGINAFSLGLLCRDEWPEEFSEIRDPEGDADGKPQFQRLKVRDAGSRYGIRYEEALALEAALLRREIDRLKAKP